MFYLSELLALVVFVLDIIAIVDVIRSRKPSAHVALWVILILFLPLLGMILYFLIGKNTTTR
jgi:hypothetical protein